MRIKTPLTKERIRTHLTYHGWYYVLIGIAAILGWNLIYTMTAPRVPENKRIDLYILSNTTSNGIVDEFLKPLWESNAPEMESVSSVVINDLGDYTVSVQLTNYIAAGEGDIYFLPETYFKRLAGQGVFLPLEEMVEDGAIDTTDIDLTNGYIAYVDEYDENDVPISSSMHLYGIPMETLYGYMTGMQIDNRGMYACIMVNNHNDENVIPFFDALIQAGRGEKADWIQ